MSSIAGAGCRDQLYCLCTSLASLHINHTGSQLLLLLLVPGIIQDAMRDASFVLSAQLAVAPLLSYLYLLFSRARLIVCCCLVRTMSFNVAIRYRACRLSLYSFHY
jgi:hypothetical protein